MLPANVVLASSRPCDKSRGVFFYICPWMHHSTISSSAYFYRSSSLCVSMTRSDVAYATHVSTKPFSICPSSRKEPSD